MHRKQQRNWLVTAVSLAAALSILSTAALAVPETDDSAAGTTGTEQTTPDTPATDQDGTDTGTSTGESSGTSSETEDTETSTPAEETTTTPSDESATSDNQTSSGGQTTTGGQTSTGGQTTSGGQTPSGESGQDAQEERTLEELRDELLTILGSEEDTTAIQENIDRMIALGDPDGTLRTYLENMIQLQQLRYETEQLEATLEQMEAANGNLGTIGTAVAAATNPDETLRRVEEDLSEPAAQLLESAGYDGTGELAELAARCLGYLDERTGGADSADVAVILLCAGLRDGEFLDATGIATAQDLITTHFSNILRRYPAVPAEVRKSMEQETASIVERSNKAEAMNPGVLVAAGKSLDLTRPVFTYDDTILLSLDDAAAFLDGTIVEMADNDTVVLQGDSVVLEMTKGSSDAYYNDRLLKMEQPLIRFDQTCYLPLDTLLECCGMARMTLGGYELLYAAP